MNSYVLERLAEAEAIEPQRRAALDSLSADLAQRLASEGALPMTFICTHNSRRSHLAQIWAQCAAVQFGLDAVKTFSGGTEATAFNPRAVAALERAGFEISVEEPSDNPVYLVDDGTSAASMRCWSKVLDDESNPSAGFVAVMTCESADEACPFVPGAWLRVALPYVDPKAFDGTEREASAYDERCEQIAREMLYLFRSVKART